MSIASRITSIEEHIENAYDSIKKFGVDTSVINRNIENIANVINDDIYDKLPKVTQSGVGFTLLDVQNGQVDDFKMNGVDLEQETVETITVSDWEQGTIDTNGTLSNSTTEVRTSNFIKVYPNILYNISRTIYNSFMKFRFYDNNKNYLGNQADINVTTDNSSNRMEANVSSMKLTINDNDVSYIKLVDSSNDLSTIYTLTTNVTPSPIYPQEIKVVEGRQVITDKGKNLFDKDNITKLNGTININSNDFEGGGLNYAVCISCKPNTTYTVTKRNDGNTNRFALASSETIPSSTISELTPVLNKIRDNDSSTLTLTTEISANYLIVQYYRSAESILTEQQILDSIQIEESSTATNYEPYYNPESYNIDLRTQNLSDGVNENYWIYATVDGVGKSGENSGLAVDVSNYNEIKIDTSITQTRYRVACTNTLPVSSTTVGCFRGVNKDNTSSSITINTTGYNYLIINATDLTKLDVYYNYELAKMPNTTYKNRIYKNNGNWYFEKNIEKINSYNDEIINTEYMSTTGQLSIGATIYYVLVNLVTTQITNATLINQLEAISVYTGTNIITISNSNNIIPEIEITRLKELEKLA